MGKGHKKKLITLMTDFGSKDWFVGAMKGAIYNLVSEVNIIDITHEIPPFQVEVGAFVVERIRDFFPAGTIHVVVVDPGVGGSRRPILVSHKGSFFIGPDNGIFSALFKVKSSEDCQVHELGQKQYFLPSIGGQTFHGRDIFAPIAAHLALGTLPDQLGSQLYDPLILKDWWPQGRENEIIGKVSYIDHFGNLITNIPSSLFKERMVEAGLMKAQIRIKGNQILATLVENYGQGDQIQPKALIGSHGHLEIFLKEENMSERYGIKLGDPVHVLGQ